MDTFLFLSLFELFFSVGGKIYRDQTLIKKKKQSVVPFLLNFRDRTQAEY